MAEQPFWIVAIIIFSIVIISAVAILISKIRPSNDDKIQRLNIVCLEMMKNNCDESLVIIDSKTFDDICTENGLNFDECKEFCGCKQ